MNDTSLFQLGVGLETGAQAEDVRNHHIRGAAERSGATGPVVPDPGLRDPAPKADQCNPSREDHFIRARDGRVYAGTHLIIEVMNGTGLDDPARIERAFRHCVAACGATLLHIHTHRFSPQGVSGVAVLAESHISVHTWPEVGYGAFDVFMCGDAAPWQAVEVLADSFETRDVQVRELLRGDGVVAA